MASVKDRPKAIPSGRMALDDVKDFAKILYYGDPGTGKTTNLASAAKLGPIVLVDAEAGVKRAALQKSGVTTDNIQLMRTIDYKALEELFFELKGELEDDPNAIAAVVLDSLTEIQKKLLEVIVRQGIDKAERRGMERGEFEVYKEDWGVNTEQMRRLIRKFRDLPCHVGFACLPRRDQDDDGTVTYGPALTPALQSDVVGYVDIICYTEPAFILKGEEMTSGLFHRVGKYTAKDRFHALPRRLVRPTFDRVIAYINGDLTEATDSVQQEARRLWAEDQKRDAEQKKEKQEKKG